MKSVINFVFTTGHRCNSSFFLDTYKLRKMNGPFDNLYVDFESALKLINTNFDDYLNDIILFNKNYKDVRLYYKKNTTEIDKRFYKLYENNLVCYMAQNYNENNLVFNQNFLDDNDDNDEELNHNIHYWNKICSFHHHNILDETIYNQVKNRCERFQRIMKKYSETITLCHVSKLTFCENMEDYVKKIIDMKNKYEIKVFLTMIVNFYNNSDKEEDASFYNKEEKCLIIFRKVEDYETQNSKYGLDNNYLNNDKLFAIMSEYFDFKLIEKSDIDIDIDI